MNSNQAEVGYIMPFKQINNRGTSRDLNELNTKKIRCLALEIIELIWSAKVKLQSTITPKSLTGSRAGRTSLPILTKFTSTNLELPDNSKLEHLEIESLFQHHIQGLVNRMLEKESTKPPGKYSSPSYQRFH